MMRRGINATGSANDANMRLLPGSQNSKEMRTGFPAAISKSNEINNPPKVGEMYAYSYQFVLQVVYIPKAERQKRMEETAKNAEEEARKREEEVKRKREELLQRAVSYQRNWISCM